jgi:hypothetical protein
VIVSKDTALVSPTLLVRGIVALAGPESLPFSTKLHSL